MKSIDDNIDTLSRAILTEAQSEADALVAQANTQADEIRKRGQVQAEDERKRILDRARQEVERIRSQAIANAHLKARSLQFQRREELLDKVFSAARQQLPGIQAWTSYHEISQRLLKEAAQQLNGDELRVRMDPKTASILDGAALKSVAEELKVEFDLGNPLEQGTGVVVETDNGRLYYDNTLENRLTRLQNLLRAPVYHLLNGEKL